MKTRILASIDKDRGVWVLEYRNTQGDVVVEQTPFPASMPSIVVCDELKKDRPQATLFAKAN
jgi:hypothetical protein